MHTFVTAVEKNMKHESQGHTTSNRCPRINTYKIKKLVKKNSYWNSDNKVAENCPPTDRSNPSKGSWSLRKLVVTEIQEQKSTFKSVFYILKMIIIIDKSYDNNFNDNNNNNNNDNQKNKAFKWF